MQNTIKNDLLKKNPKALQFLHHVKGYDFTKPYVLRAIDGRFTFNTVAKAIQEETTGDYVASLLVEHTEEYGAQELRFAVVGASKFDGTRIRDLEYWRYNIGYSWGVGDFEEMRKNKTKRVYIIAQKREYLAPQEGKPVDLSGRFALDPKAWRSVEHHGDGKGNNYIGKLNLIRRDGSNAKFEYKPYHSFYANEKKSDVLGDFLDKSGYLLRPGRMELKRKAIARKAEKDKKAVETYDFSEENKKILDLFASARKHLVSLIEKASTYGEADAVNDATFDFKQMFYHLEVWRKEDFSCVASKLSRYEAIEKYANRVLSRGGSEQ